MKANRVMEEFARVQYRVPSAKGAPKAWSAPVKIEDIGRSM